MADKSTVRVERCGDVELRINALETEKIALSNCYCTCCTVFPHIGVNSFASEVYTPPSLIMVPPFPIIEIFTLAGKLLKKSTF